MHKSLDEFEIRLDPTTDHRVSCPLASEKLMFPFFLALYNHSQVSIVALWATSFDFIEGLNGSMQKWMGLIDCRMILVIDVVLVFIKHT